MSFQFYTPSRGGNHSRVDAMVRLKTATRGDAIRGTFTLTKQVMNDARFVAGDRVLIGFDFEQSTDETILVCFKRDPKSGFKISKTKDNGTSGYIQMTCNEVFGFYPAGSTFETDDVRIEGATVYVSLDRIA